MCDLKNNRENLQGEAQKAYAPRNWNIVKVTWIICGGVAAKNNNFGIFTSWLELWLFNLQNAVG